MVSKLFIDDDDSRYCGVCGSTKDVKRIVEITDMNTGKEYEKSIPICMDCLRNLRDILSRLFEDAK